MTFKELTNDLMLQGWRTYYVDDIDAFTRGHKLNTLAIRSLLEVMVYEGKNVIFVRTIHPKLGEEELVKTDNDD